MWGGVRGGGGGERKRRSAAETIRERREGVIFYFFLPTPQGGKAKRGEVVRGKLQTNTARFVCFVFFSQPPEKTKSLSFILTRQQHL